MNRIFQVSNLTHLDSLIASKSATFKNQNIISAEDSASTLRKDQLQEDQQQLQDRLPPVPARTHQIVVTSKQLQESILARSVKGPPYVCDMCGASFATMGKFTRHQKRHLDEKPFPCTVCFRPNVLDVVGR